MRHRDLTLPPEFIYPIEDWRWVEKRFEPKHLGRNESVFAVSNGYLGMRGGFEEGTPAHLHGTFVNAFHETWPIPYGERAHGFARTGQTIVNIPDPKVIRLYVDDERFDMTRATILRYERALDLRAGTLDRLVEWETPSGKRLRVISRRLVSFHERHLAAIYYEVTVLNTRTSLEISSEIIEHGPDPFTDVERNDPRQARPFAERVLDRQFTETEDQRIRLGYVTRESGMTLACGIDHTLETDCGVTDTLDVNDHFARVVFSVDAEPGKPIRLTKYITVHSSRTICVDEQTLRARRSLDRAVRHGFGQILDDQRMYLDKFWERSDVRIRTDHPRAQQSIRWNLYQLLQAYGRADGSGVPAKGLTGQAYEGQYFWDMEMYVLPFLTYTNPLAAKNLLKFRYVLLEQARNRAREVSQRGALFPWRTINGEEASAYYAAGTAQYHINAAIAYAIQKYVDVSGDRSFLYEFGAEILVETARLWLDLGFFSERRDGKFCIHGVTGPDEYTTVVNDNTYTNLMARENLRYAVAAVDELREQAPEAFALLVHRTGLHENEAREWTQAADLMYVPFDEKLGIHPQDANFLEREMWDFANTPPENYPLLLHYHPLVIYRHQVIKQADIVLVMFLLSHEFSREQKQLNFDYYDPITTGDSSLSACIQGITAAELGDGKKAIEYLLQGLLIDLADLAGNARDGCHIASMGGTWMAVVYGLAGLRDHRGIISFDPRPIVGELHFPLMIRGRRLEVSIQNGTVTYLLRRGDELEIHHRGEVIDLIEGDPVTRSLHDDANAEETQS